MIEDAWKPATDAQHHQWALAGASDSSISVCQLPGGPSLKIVPQMREAVSLGLWLILLYQIYEIDSTPKYA